MSTKELFLQKLLTKFLIIGTLIATILNPIAVKAEVITDGMNPETELIGTLIQTEIDMTFDLMATYTIDPNSKTQKLTSDDITATNNGVAATKISIKSFSSDNTLEDILPYELEGLDEYSSTEEIQVKWNNLGVRLSSSKIALKLFAKENSVLRAKGQDNIYFKTLKNAEDTYLGDIDAGQSCSWSVDGYFGLAYKEEINTTHKIVWAVELTE